MKKIIGWCDDLTQRTHNNRNIPSSDLNVFLLPRNNQLPAESMSIRVELFETDSKKKKQKRKTYTNRQLFVDNY